VPNAVPIAATVAGDVRTLERKWTAVAEPGMVRLSEHTTTTATEALDEVEVALLPTGATEQHGPALPLGTDFVAARALAGSLEDSEDAVVLPTVPVGVSEHHRQFDGTLWVDADAFEWYVRDVIESIASHGIRKAVVVNGHGGNSDALRRAARGLRQDRIAFAAPWNWWNSVQDLEAELFDGAGGHADAMESSMLLHVAAEHVREDALEAAEDGASEGWGKQVHGANVGFDTIDFSDSGACGTPTEASPEAGRELFERASGELEALVEWLAGSDLEGLWPREHR
jgi:creatinine amidohydrolase